jgi:serine/threonine protein kinase
MGAIYLAEDRRAFGRLCVIKQMLDYYNPADPEERTQALKRFEVEGRTLATLSHPGIPKIYAFFEENGRFYLVMEYIQGETLESFITRESDTGQLVVPTRRLPQEEVVRYAIQVCRILEYLHSQARPVVHGDIKPGNMILEAQLGDIRLVDFGTVSVQAQQQAMATADNVPPSGETAYGTEGYAPPEQYRGVLVPRSDVFSLAATTYHLLTDDDPVRHRFKWDMLKTLPRELGLALERALRPAPEQRSTAAELRQALEAIATPKRTLQNFTFPGGTQIRSVGALPALCDEHWDAARSFLYNGDFQRWLRDINRHDLVIAADTIVAQQPNHDAGLESFLRLVDPGLTRPKLVVDPTGVNLGPIARESALIRRISLLNVTRGYTIASLGSTQPWLEIYPAAVHLWAGRPVDIRVSVHAEGLPFRSKQEGIIAVRSEEQALEVPVTAQVSLWREVWRLIRRAILAAVPESWRMFVSTLRTVRRVTRAVRQPFMQRPWIFWLVWFLLSAAVGLTIYFAHQSATWPVWLIGARTFILDRLPEPLDLGRAALAAVLGPPAFFLLLWVVFAVMAPLIAAIVGALRGAFKSFFR